MVCNIGLLKGMFEGVREGEVEEVQRCMEGYVRDIVEVTEGCMGRIVKCIIETGALEGEEIVAAALLFNEARRRVKEDGGEGPHFIKTSTGFNGFGGAKVGDVEVMARIVRPGGGKVKASGGVGDLEQAKRIVEAGAERIGASKGVRIVEGREGGGGGY